MNEILSVGLILIAALLSGHVAQLMRVPEVTGYLLVGVAIGPAALDLISHENITTLGFLSDENTINVWLMPVFWFAVKVLLLVFCTWWLRASLPRMRYDRLMALGWKYLIEIAILWVLVSAALVVAREEDWNVWIVTPVAAGIALAAFGVLFLSMPKAGEELEEFR